MPSAWSKKEFVTRRFGLLLARKGSKGLPGKNTRLFLGKPLFRYGLDVGAEMPEIELMFVSSDDRDLLAISAGPKIVSLVRPDDLASDETPMMDVIKFERKRINDAYGQPDVWIVFLGNSPTLTSAMVRRCCEALDAHPAIDSVIPVVELPQWTPLRALRTDGDELSPWVPSVATYTTSTNRQAEAMTLFATNAFFVVRDEGLEHADASPFCLPWMGRRSMGIVDPHGGLDIDTEADLVTAEAWWDRARKAGEID